MTLRQWLPASITLVVIACGLGALEATRSGHWDLAFVLIVAAAVADGLDGRVARWLRANGPMGGQFDSLADIITFGAAPAALFLARVEEAPVAMRFAIALTFVAAGVFRLARFGMQPKSDEFCGMPITCAGALFASATAAPFAGAMPAIAAIGLLLAGLMVSHIPFPKLTTLRWQLAVPPVVSALAYLRWPAADTAALLSLGAFGAYTLWSVIGSLQHDDDAMGGLSEDVAFRP